MNRLFALFFLSFLFAFFLSPVFGQLELGNDTFQLNMMQNVKNSVDYVKPENDWGKSRSYTDFDPLLGERFQYVLDSLMAKYYMIGASACVIMPEKGTWKGVYGMSDPVRGDSIKPDMLFWIDSNTKTFVSTIILQLEEEGILTLDDELDQWLPNFKNIDSTITIRQLLNHTAGLNDFLNENPVCGNQIFADTSRYWSPEYTLSYVLSPNFVPGSSWSYSNTGYILAGLIIRQATGETNFASPLRQKILNPLNLTHTFMGIEETLNGELAHGWYVYHNGNYVDMSVLSSTAFRSSAWTAGAIVSTAEDMARWVGALYGGKVLSDNALNSMRTLVPIGDWLPNRLGYGLGTINWLCLGESLWCHGGSTSGSLSQVAYFERKNVSMAVMLNCYSYLGVGMLDITNQELLRVILNYYKYPHDKVYPNHARLNALYFKPNQDSVKLSVHVNNPENHTVLSFSKITNTDSTYQDSIALYDDGLHSDSLAGDMIFGGAFKPLPIEDDFTLSLLTFDLDSSYHHILEDANRITTIGPLVFDGYTIISFDTIPNPGDVISFKINLKNNGINKSAKDISANISSSDSSVLIHGFLYTSTFGDIEPGKIVTSDRPYLIEIKSNCNEEKEIHFDVSISSHGYTFWNDTFSIQVKSETKVIADNAKKLPTEFILHQNFPNPFNAQTIIGYQLPKAGHVSVAIYNLLGQRIITLTDKKHQAGQFNLIWDGKDSSGRIVPSGVYFYRLETENFSDIKKMLLLH